MPKTEAERVRPELESGAVARTPSEQPSQQLLKSPSHRSRCMPVHPMLDRELCVFKGDLVVFNCNP